MVISLNKSCHDRRHSSKKDNAYNVDGNVYFDVTTADDYGKLSNRRLEDQQEGTREDVRGEKRNAADFALWKRADDGHIQQWESPWGVGYPGWHIECSAMAKKYLGDNISIFMVVVLIIFIRTMKMKSYKVNALTRSILLIIGCSSAA